jgi:hypothetical protein
MNSEIFINICRKLSSTLSFFHAKTVTLLFLEKMVETIYNYSENRFTCLIDAEFPPKPQNIDVKMA